ncbi:hypothetical protein ACFQDG_02955 [Natronoarchaeum mannanilyticum]|uniref:PGF-CTERM sorting domain-containing protein n=1 Tax=Natronoarchaeum mannanilyticum TaxID=926360 RepID=A0AAV3T644_9EURY
MRRIFLALLLATAAALAMGMGVGPAIGQENESGDELDLPPEVAASEIVSLIENDPDEVPAVTIERVQEWGNHSAVRDELTDEQLSELDEWLAKAPDPEELRDEQTAAPIDEKEDLECERVVDNQTCVTAWTYDEGTFTLTFWSEEGASLGLTEASDWSENSKQFAYASKEIDAGETTVTFRVYQESGAGVGIMSEAAREAEQGGAIISTGSDDADQNPLQTFGGESGLFTGVIMSVVLAALSAAYVVRSEDSGVIEA